MLFLASIKKLYPKNLTLIWVGSLEVRFEVKRKRDNITPCIKIKLGT